MDQTGKTIDLYRRRYKEWDTHRGNVLLEKKWLDKLLELMQPDAPVLDIGCGTGDPIARYFLAQGRPVIGVDSSPELIALCKERFPSAEWFVGDMRTLFTGTTFGGIIAWDSFFHLTPDEQRAMFKTFRDHATQGTALLFTSGPKAGEAIGEFGGEPLYHASLDPAEYQRLLNEQEFEIISHASEDPDCGGHSVWLARSR